MDSQDIFNLLSQNWKPIVAAIPGIGSLVWQMKTHYADRREQLEITAWYIYNTKRQVNDDEIVKGCIVPQAVHKFAKDAIMRTGVDMAITNKGAPVVIKEGRLLVNNRMEFRYPLRERDGEPFRLEKGDTLERGTHLLALWCSARKLNDPKASVRIEITTTSGKKFSAGVLENLPEDIWLD